MIFSEPRAAVAGLALAAVAAAACELVDDARATAPDAPAVRAMAQSADSIVFEAVWTAGRNADGTMAPMHDWRAGPDSGDAWERHGSIPASDSTADGRLGTTFTAPRADSAVDAFFCVEARNAVGTSEPACNGYTVPARAAAPSAPGAPSLDTLDADLAFDSLRVWPDSAEVPVGDSVAIAGLVFPEGDVGFVCAETTDGRRLLVEASRGDSAPVVEIPVGARTIEYDCDADVTWESSKPDTVPVRRWYVFRSDSSETGVRAVEYGFAVVESDPGSTSSALRTERLVRRVWRQENGHDERGGP